MVPEWVCVFVCVRERAREGERGKKEIRFQCGYFHIKFTLGATSKFLTGQVYAAVTDHANAKGG